MPVLTPQVDIANARLRFASGCIANLTASRISRDQVRKIRFFQPDMYVSIDYAAQEVEVWRLRAPRRRAAGDRRRRGGGRPARSRSSASWRTSSTRFATAGAPLVDRRRRPARARAGARRLPIRWQLTQSRAGHDSTKRSVGLVTSSSCYVHVHRPQRLHRRPRQAQASSRASREPVSPDLEIAAVTDRVCKSPGGGPALLFEKPTGLRHAGRGQPVRLDRAHVPGARRRRRSTTSRARSTS